MTGRARRLPRSFAILLLAGAALPPAIIPAQAAAQDAPDIHDRVVVTASALRTLEAESLQHIDVVTLDEIQEDYAGSLGDTLARLPGVSSTFFGPAAGRPVVRGLGGDRTKVMTNGVGLVDASAASPDHAAASEGLEAESIEILRGSAALSYGGNAISGVVNVIDGTVPSAAPEDGLDGQFYLGGESVNDAAAAAGSVSLGSGPLVVTLQGVRRTAGDYSIPGFAESAAQRALEEAEEHEDEDHDHEEEEEHEEVRDVVPNSGYEFTSGSVGASLVGDWGFFGLAVKQFDAQYGLPGHEHVHEHEDEDHEDEDREDEEGHGHEEESPFIDMEQTRVDVRGEIDLPGGPFETLRVSGGWADYGHTEFEAENEPGTVFASDGWEGRVELAQPDRDGWTGAVGAQAADKDFSSVGEEALIPETNTRIGAVFAAQRLDRGAWGVEGGARLETVDVSNAIAERDFTAASASAGVFLRPVEGLFLGGTVAHTERAPTDAELFSDGPHLATGQYEVGDVDLGKETALSLEAVARYDAGRVELEGALWRADYDGFIFLAQTGLEEDGLPVFRHTQADAELWGAELGASAALFKAAGAEFSADAALEYTRGQIDGGADLPRIPPLSATLGLEAAGLDGTLKGRVELVAVAEQDKTFPGELATEGYEMVNVSATWRPDPDGPLRVIAGVRNLTDAEGRVHASYLKDALPLPGRSFRLALSARF